MEIGASEIVGGICAVIIVLLICLLYCVQVDKNRIIAGLEHRVSGKIDEVKNLEKLNDNIKLSRDEAREKLNESQAALEQLRSRRTQDAEQVQEAIEKLRSANEELIHQGGLKKELESELYETNRALASLRLDHAHLSFIYEHNGEWRPGNYASTFSNTTFNCFISKPALIGPTPLLRCHHKSQSKTIKAGINGELGSNIYFKYDSLSRTVKPSECEAHFQNIVKTIGHAHQFIQAEFWYRDEGKPFFTINHGKETL